MDGWGKIFQKNSGKSKMDATCTIQDGIHVFCLVLNMCPEFWVHIEVNVAFLLVKRFDSWVKLFELLIALFVFGYEFSVWLNCSFYFNELVAGFFN